MNADEIQDAIDRLGISLTEAEYEAYKAKIPIEDYLEKRLSWQPEYIKSYSYPRYEVAWVQMPRAKGGTNSFRVLIRHNTTPFYDRRTKLPIFRQIMAVDNPSQEWMIGKSPSQVHEWLSTTSRENQLEKLNRQMKTAIRKRQPYVIQQLDTEIEQLKLLDDVDIDNVKGWLYAIDDVAPELNEMPSKIVMRKKHWWDLADIARKPEGYVIPQTGRKIGIVGSRRRGSPQDYQELMDQFLKVYREGDTIVSGGANAGADKFAKKMATNYNIPYIEHIAKWGDLDVPGAVIDRYAYGKHIGERYNRNAGIDRNALIARDSDILIAMPVEERAFEADIKNLERQLNRAIRNGNQKAEITIRKQMEFVQEVADIINNKNYGGTNTTIDLFNYNNKGEYYHLPGKATTNKKGIPLATYNGPRTDGELRRIPKYGTNLATLNEGTPTKKIITPLHKTEGIHIPEIPESFRFDITPKPIGSSFRKMSPDELRVRSTIEKYYGNLKTDVININKPPTTMVEKFDAMLGKMKRTVVPLKETMYIGRPVKWDGTKEMIEGLRPGQRGYFGNPFPLYNESERAKVIEDFSNYFYDRLKTDPQYKAAIHNLKGETLGCHCNPKACHGNVIQQYIDQLPPDEIPNYKVAIQRGLNDIDSPNAKFFSINPTEERVIDGRKLGKQLDDIARLSNIQTSGAAWDPSTNPSTWERLGYKLEDADKAYLETISKITKPIGEAGKLLNRPWAYQGPTLRQWEGVGRMGGKKFWSGGAGEYANWIKSAKGFGGSTGRLATNLGGKIGGGLVEFAPLIAAQMAYNQLSSTEGRQYNLGVLGKIDVPQGMSESLAPYSTENYGLWGDYVIAKALEAAGEKGKGGWGQAFGTLPRAVAAGAYAIPNYFNQRLNYGEMANKYGQTWMVDPQALSDLGLSREEIDQVMPWLEYQRNLQANWRTQGKPTGFRTVGVSAMNPAWGSTPGLVGITPGQWIVRKKIDDPLLETGYVGVPT